VLAEFGMKPFDPAQRIPDACGDGGTGALDRISQPPNRAAQTNRARQFVDQRLPLSAIAIELALVIVVFGVGRCLARVRSIGFGR
jgi:hypothetical protein